MFRYVSADETMGTGTGDVLPSLASETGAQS